MFKNKRLLVSTAAWLNVIENVQVLWVKWMYGAWFKKSVYPRLISFVLLLLGLILVFYSLHGTGKN